MSEIDQLSKLQKRVSELNNRKIVAQTTLSHLKTQYTSAIEELKSLGITDTSNLPSVLKDWEENLAAMLLEIETKISSIESELAND